MSEARSGNDEQWTLAEWSKGRRRNFIRSQNGLTVPDPRRPVKILVKFVYRSWRLDGQPNGETHDRLAEIEEVLVDEFRAHNAELVMVLTGYSARDFMAYSESAEWLEEWGPTVLARWRGVYRNIGIEAELDRDWVGFRQFLPS